MTEEEFREPVPRAEKIGPNVFATAEEIAGSFFLLGRNVNGRQRAGTIQDSELACVAAVCLDAIAGTSRNQCGRDYLTGNLAGAEGPL